MVSLLARSVFFSSCGEHVYSDSGLDRCCLQVGLNINRKDNRCCCWLFPLPSI